MSYYRFGDDIEMPADFVGKGADPNMVGQPVPTTPVIEGAFKNMVGSIANLFGGPTLPAKPVGTAPGRLSPKPSIMPTVVIAGLVIGAVIYLSKKANQ